MKIFTLFFISLLFLGCVANKQAEPLAYPSWYLNPPQNNGDSLYGVGEGRDINSAKASALNAIAASLSITVSSEFKKSESSSSVNGNENAYHSALNTVKAEVKEMEFSSYQVIQNQFLSNTMLVLVEVSRQQLFNDQKNKLNLFFTELQSEQENIRRQSPLKQAYLYAQSEQKRQKLKSLALLCKSINSAFNTAPYMEQASKIQEDKRKALDNAKVSITAEGEAKLFVSALKEGLNRAGIKTVSGNANTAIHLKNSFQTDEIYGFKIAKATLSLSTQDNSAKNIATRTLNLSGKSRYDYDKAKVNSAQVLSEKIDQEGIFSILGIQ